jgi:K+-transporting ATPase A subunit
MIYLIIYCIIVIASSLVSKPLTQQLKQTIDNDEVDVEYATSVFCVIPIVNIFTFICSIIIYVRQIFRKN